VCVPRFLFFFAQQQQLKQAVSRIFLKRFKFQILKTEIIDSC
jgi:hypothetical protein